MPINLSSGSDDFVPYMKYNAKAGRFYIRPQGSSEDVEVVNPRLAIDLENIKTGWIYFSQEGGAPEKVWDPTLATPASKPAGPKKFRRGFEVMVFGADDLPGIGKLGLREWCSNASNVNAAMLKMYDAYEKAASANPGKVPFFACKRVIPVTGAYGTNYEPDFQLVAWVDRTKVPAFDEHLEKAASHPSGNGHAGAPIDHPAAESNSGVLGGIPGDPFYSDSIPF